MKNAIGIIVIGVLVFLVGCGPQTRPEDQVIVKGKDSLVQAVAELQHQKETIASFRAAADCTVSFLDDKGKLKNEEFSATIRFVPPGCVYLKGDKFGEIFFGTNDEEFWLRIKPADIDTYWWGTKANADNCSQHLILNPFNITEAFGITDVDLTWAFLGLEGTDVLTLYDADVQRIIKRVHIDTADYRVARIENFDRRRTIVTTTELSDYLTTSDGVTVPRNILITYYNERGDVESSIRIKIKGAKLFEMPEEKLQRLFERPGRDGYKYMYELSEDCQFMKQ